jgi:ATP-dependent Lhr-like helicase
LGVPVPPGVPAAFTEPVDDPLADLVGRYARTHGPFLAGEVAQRLGLGVAVVRHTLQRLEGQGRVVSGEFRPAAEADSTEWCDTEVLRRLRRRSLARLRQEIEPVSPATLARFALSWQRVSTAQRALRGIDGVLATVDQMAGVPVPASALESLVLGARVRDFEPAYLDELTATGEVVWAGHGSLAGADGWVSLHLADQAPLTLPEPAPVTDVVQQRILDALAPGGAWFFRQLSDQVAVASRAAGDEPPDDPTLSAALWQLVWTGHVTNDTLTPLRALTRNGSAAHRSRGPAARPGRVSRTGPPETAGRWSLLPPVDADPTRRAHATAERLLDRHGVVTRGAVTSEGVPGGFAAVYRVLSAFEDSGRCRRGYFVEGLGAAQFATPGAVDRLRTHTTVGDKPVAVALAATDPASPYGAALPWPEAGEDASGHRPGRKAGALVVLVDGELVLYVERGGRTLLTWSDSPAQLEPAAEALSTAVRRGNLGRLTVEKADGAPLLGTSSPLRDALASAGFVATPRGLRLRS